ITAAYAFTDYHSQGQMIPYVLVDITRPPEPPLSLFNVYVLLRRPHNVELIVEDDRLDKLDRETSRWWEEMSRSDT
ncbi:hypothetical protein BDN71DRAFT_1405185, partial [Pleurotus eryngii]